MEQEKSLDLPVEACLKELGISSIAQWDVLVFLHRHQLSLASAEQIARLLGYQYQEVGDALDTLESLRLIQRSRASKSVRLYQLVHSETHLPPPGFRQLMTLAETRTGRLLLGKKLRDRRGSAFTVERNS